MTASERARRSWIMGCAWKLFRRDRAQGFGRALSRAWALARELEERERGRCYDVPDQRPHTARASRSASPLRNSHPTILGQPISIACSSFARLVRRSTSP